MSSLDWFTDSGATQAETSTNVYDKRYAKLVFNKSDVRAIYIDWDDGTDNSKENANYQWLQFDYPISSTVVEHTYTKTGSFRPIVQTVNSQGIFSKYYQNATSNTSIAPLESSSRIETIAVSDKTATGVMRLENKQVLSGIDNSLFDKYGPMDLYFAVAPTLTAGEAVTPVGTSPVLEIEAEVVYGVVSGSEGPDAGGSSALITITHTGTQIDVGAGVQQINSVDYRVRRITKVKWINSKLIPTSSYSAAQKYDEHQNFNKLKLFLLTSGAALTAGGGSMTPYYPITYVTDGCPIKLADDARRVVNFDMAQSRTAAANTSISGYYYANGKNWFTPAETWSGTATTLVDVSGGTTADYSVAYTYQPRPDGLMRKGDNTDADDNYVIAFDNNTSAGTWIVDATSAPRQDQFLLDEFNRLVPQGHLLRTYVSASSTSGSSLDNYKGIYRVSPALNWNVTGAQNPVGAVSQSICKLYEDQGVTTIDYSKDLTANGYSNTQTGQLDLDGVNTLAYKDRNNNARTAYEYLILVGSKKHNKIFVQASPYAKNLMSNASGGTNNNEIAGLYYLHAENHRTVSQNLYWKPLKFEDGTKVVKEYRDTSGDTYTSTGASFSKSGFIEFDMPTDWSGVSFFDVCSQPSDWAGWGTAESGIPSATPTVNQFEFQFTASCSAASGGGTQGKTCTFVRTAGEWPAGISGTASNIGAYKYLAIVKSGTVGGSTTDGIGQAYWVADGFEDGYDGTNTITLQVGENLYWGGGAPAVYGAFAADDSNYVFTLRRVNFYDVFDGASKVWSTNASGAAADAWFIDNVDSDDATPWPNRFGFISGSYLGDAVSDGWGGNDYYAIKMVLKGSNWESGSSTNSPLTGNAVGKVGTEIWNIQPYNDSASQYVEEIDDTAYTLNSLPITSDIAVARKGNYYQAITRKGKVFIAKTGVGIENISFNSVALGDEGDTKSNKFDSHGPATLYGHLRTVRNLQAEAVRVYWDEQQKDGTYIRFWGIITDVADTRGANGPRSVVNYTFNMTVEEIAIYDGNKNMITDIFPLGGIESVRTYS